MRTRHRIGILFVTLLLIAASAADVLACACCAEPGTYSIRTLKPDSFHLELLGELKFAPKAKLFMTEAGFEMIKGLDAVEKEDAAVEASITDGFDLAASFSVRRTWNFEFRTPKGLRGSVTFPIPASMVSFAADIHDNEDKGLGPLLYKELRFKGNVSSATGFMRAGVARGTTYFLVFQGRGRGCDEVFDFKNWRLEIEGPRAGYAFYGRLTSSETPQAE
jgi:hypothetical protein